QLGTSLVEQTHGPVGGKGKAGAIGGNGKTAGLFILRQRQRPAVQRGMGAVVPITDSQTCGAWRLQLDNTEGALQRWAGVAVRLQTTSPLKRLNDSAGTWSQGAICRTRIISKFCKPLLDLCHTGSERPRVVEHPPLGEAQPGQMAICTVVRGQGVKGNLRNAAVVGYAQQGVTVPIIDGFRAPSPYSGAVGIEYSEGRVSSPEH